MIYWINTSVWIQLWQTRLLCALIQFAAAKA
jgi:hypothetical protein